MNACKFKKKNNIIIAVHAGKAFDRFKNPFQVRTLCKPGMKGAFY